MSCLNGCWRTIGLVPIPCRGNSATPGDYKHIQNYVVNSKTKGVIYTPPAAFEVLQIMRKLIDWINLETEKFILFLMSGIAKFQLVCIHPFLDGKSIISQTKG